MTHVKFFLFMFFAFNLTLVDFASAQRRGGGYGGGDRYGNGNGGAVTCSARTTRFFEKHILGHANCNTCRAKHDSCTEECSQTSNVCTVQGTDYNGYTRIFTASGNQYQAEQEAFNQCEYNRNMSNCVSLGCNTQSYVVSSRNCQ